MSAVTVTVTLGERCRRLLKQLLARAYALNVMHPECGFVIPVYRPSRIRDVRDFRVMYRTLERCLAKVWPFFSYSYIGNYKRIVIVHGISLTEFKKRAGL